jgi:hypothetical protein
MNCPACGAGGFKDKVTPHKPNHPIGPLPMPVDETGRCLCVPGTEPITLEEHEELRKKFRLAINALDYIAGGHRSSIAATLARKVLKEIRKV